MRSEATLSEQRLWLELRGSRLGVAFRRQVPICRFIADFAAPSIKLVVEVDGGYHADRIASDAKRDALLGRLGWRIVHVADHVVIHEIASALAAIAAAIRAG